MYSSTIDILVVEDNPYDSELTIQGIKQGHEKANPIIFENAAAAIDFIRTLATQSSNLGLAMIDIDLQKADGFAVLKAMRENENTRFVPAVILSGSEEEQRIENAFRLGANSYVIKPTQYEKYMNAIKVLTYYWSVVNAKPGDWNHHQNN